MPTPSTHATDQALPDEPSDECTMQVMDLKGLMAVLQALKFWVKQVCQITINEEGLLVQCEDASKGLQGSVSIPPKMFNEFKCPPGVRHDFGLPLHMLMDTLGIFASVGGDGTFLQMRYSSRTQALACNLQDDRHDVIKMTTYARLAVEEPPNIKSLLDFWKGPASHFLATAGLLREAVDDLEWTGQDVSIIMRGNPEPQLTFHSQAETGKLQIDIPVDDLQGFHVAEPLLPIPSLSPRQQQGPHDPTFKYKSMKAAFCSLHTGKGAALADTSTKVFLDVNGMLKVSHVVSFGSGPVGTQGMQEMGSVYDHTQASHMVFITFVITPAVEDD